MKHLFTAVFIMSMVILHGADYAKINQDAQAAMKQKDYAAAETKFDEAVKAASDSVQKCNAILGKFNAMRSQKKYTEAEKFALAAVEDETLKSPEIRQILNTVAHSLLWSSRPDFALELLRQAQNFECPSYSNTYYSTFYCTAVLYQRKKQPKMVIEVMENVLKVKSLHPGNRSAANMMIGDAYEKLGNKEEALKHYKAALEASRQVKYKCDFSHIEKAIERLSK